MPVEMLNLDDEENRDYKPLRIYEQRMKNGRRELLVRWRGFSMREASWVPEKAIEGSAALLAWQTDRHDVSHHHPRLPPALSREREGAAAAAGGGVGGELVGRRGGLVRRLVAAVGRSRAVDASGSPTASVDAQVARREPRGRMRRRLLACSRAQMLKLAQVAGGGVAVGPTRVSRGTFDGSRTTRVRGSAGTKIS